MYVDNRFMAFFVACVAYDKKVIHMWVFFGEHPLIAFHMFSLVF